MKEVTKFESDDGTLHDTLQDALQADVKFWKSKAEEFRLQLESISRRRSEEDRSRRAYDGGHQ